MTTANSELSQATAKTGGNSPKYKGKTGAKILHQMLVEEHGVEVIWGYPGGAILPVFDELYKTKAQFILTRHEQGAGHAADGYARASGKVGVVIVTSGPGATNTVTPLATAQMDSVPMVVISGQVATKAIGNDAFQEADVTGITRPCTKWNYLVKDIRELPRIINEAFMIATSGRPGPVVIDLPKDVSAGSCPVEVDASPRPHVLAKRHTALHPPEQGRQAKTAAEMINRAKRPLLYVGGGCIIAGADQVLRQVAAKGNIPVTTTLLGLGAFDEHSPLSLYMLGMHGSAAANYAVQECDCLIAVGARFDDRVTGNLACFAPKAKVIHVDIDPSSINKVVDVDVTVVGDARMGLELMLEHIEARDRSEWLARVSDWKQRHPFAFADDGANLKPQAVVAEIHRQTQGEATIVTGVGQHQMWAAQFYRWRRPRQMITSGGLGTMGYGLPAAMGAALALPGKTVIDIDGDGSFLMTSSELATIAEYRIPVKMVILNNQYLGMVKQWQDLFYQKRYSQSRLQNPDFPTLAKAFGLPALRCERKEDVGATVEAMLACEGPVLAEFPVEPDEHVYPIVSPGKGLHEMDFGTVDRLKP